jgi:hypothetical protein
MAKFIFKLLKNLQKIVTIRYFKFSIHGNDPLGVATPI